MLVIIPALIGAFWGGYTAKKRGGNRLDIAQYATGFAFALGILGMVLTVVVHRAAL